METCHPEAKSGNAGRLALRRAAIASMAIGIFLNSITISQNAVLGWRAPLILSAWAYVPLTISLGYSILDAHNLLRLRGRSSSSNKPGAAGEGKCTLRPPHSLPLPALLLLDTLGFVAFLTLLIANGVVITTGLGWRGGGRPNKIVLLAYNSVPWIFASAIHLVVILRAVADLGGFSLTRRATCPECKRSWRRGQKDESYRGLLRDSCDYDEDADAEENAGGEEGAGRGKIMLEDDA